MIDCTPEVMPFSINFHKDFIEMPLPITRLQAPGPSLFDLACELRAKPVPPVADRFIADIYTTLMKQVFTFLSESGNLTYSITASWMISGLVLK